MHGLLRLLVLGLAITASNLAAAEDNFPSRPVRMIVPYAAGGGAHPGKREIVQARQITMYLAKAFTKNSLKTIGEHFGGRDHTTVIHSCQTVKDLMDTDSLFRENVMELQQKVQLAAM